MLIGLELEGRLAVSDHHKRGLGTPSTRRCVHGLSKSKSLGHVGEALFLHHALNCTFHCTQNRQRLWGHSWQGTIWHDNSFAELNQTNLHCSCSEILTGVLGQQIKSLILEAVEAILAQGSAAINRDDQIMVGNANLVTHACGGHIWRSAAPGASRERVCTAVTLDTLLAGDEAAVNWSKWRPSSKA